MRRLCSLISNLCLGYIIVYELLRVIYVLILMPLAGGTWGSVVGAMILMLGVMIAATIALFRNDRWALPLIVLYAIGVSSVWFVYEIPSWQAYGRDRSLDWLLVAAYVGYSYTRMLRIKGEVTHSA